MKRNAIIIDLDGTLCNNDHRRHLVEAEKPNWPAFNAGCVDDSLNEWCAQIFHRFDHVMRIFVSGRTDEYERVTKAWLEKHGIRDYYLFMRKDKDWRKDSEIKTEIYKEHIEPYCNVLFCVDDRKQVVDMWRSLGLVCLQCAEGNF